MPYLRYECGDADRDKEEVRMQYLSRKALSELVAMNTQPIIVCDEGTDISTITCTMTTAHEGQILTTDECCESYLVLDMVISDISK